MYVPIKALGTAVTELEGQIDALGVAEAWDIPQSWLSTYFGIGGETAKAVNAFGAVAALSGALVLTNNSIDDLKDKVDDLRYTTLRELPLPTETTRGGVHAGGVHDGTTISMNWSGVISTSLSVQLSEGTNITITENNTVNVGQLENGEHKSPYDSLKKALKRVALQEPTITSGGTVDVITIFDKHKYYYCWWCFIKICHF